MSEKLLTIGMATFDDYDGVYFTIQALRMFHLNEIENDVEIIVVDNNPSSKHGQAVEKFLRLFTKAKYIPFEEKKGTSIRDEIFKNASGKYTICTDCHVLFQPNAIKNLLDFYKKNPETNDLIQGPLWNDDLKNLSTHFDPVWKNDMYGFWKEDKEQYKNGEPFEIPMMGLGVFSCRTKAWLGFNKKFKTFGGEEWYIHEKFRKKGGKCLCLPSFGWVHRFARPNGVPYPQSFEDRVYNYFVGALENYETENHPFIESIIDNFSKNFPKEKILKILEKARTDLSNNSYLNWKNTHQAFELNYHKHSNFRWPGRESEWNEQWNNIFELFGEFSKDSFSSESILLDIGCGSKPALEWFNNGIKYNIDPLLQEYLKIKQISHYWETFNKEQLINAPAEELQNNLINKCDFIICWNVLDHSYNWRKILENAANYLNKNGVFLLGTDHGHKSHIGHPGIENSQELFDQINNLFVINKHVKRGFKTCRTSAFILQKK